MNSVKTCLLTVCVVVTGAVWAQDAQVVTVQQTDIKRIAGEVVQVRGNLLTLRHDDGSGREAYRIPRGASIRIKGEEGPGPEGRGIAGRQALAPDNDFHQFTIHV